MKGRSSSLSHIFLFDMLVTQCYIQMPIPASKQGHIDHELWLAHTHCQYPLRVHAALLLGFSPTFWFSVVVLCIMLLKHCMGMTL